MVPTLARALDPGVAGNILRWFGEVSYSHSAEGTWLPAYTKVPLAYGGRVRVGENSSVSVRWSGNKSLWEVNEEGLFLIMEKPEEGVLASLRRGLCYMFHRDRPGTDVFETPVVRAGSAGTEYVVKVEDDGTTTIWVIDGQVNLTNDLGSLTLRSDQAGTVRAVAPPVGTAMIEAATLVQWILYYPGVLHVDELGLTEGEQAALSESLAAYQAGDLHQALAPKQIKLIRWLRDGAIGAVAAVVLGWGFWKADAGKPLAHGSYDYLFCFRPAPSYEELTNDVAIIYMDQASVGSLQIKDPNHWDRSRHAQLIDRLQTCGARVVVLDVQFQFLTPLDPIADSNLVAAARSFGKVVVGGEGQPGGNQHGRALDTAGAF